MAEGQQLEIGAQRAPRFLVVYILDSHKSWFQILQVQLAPSPDLSSNVFLNLVNTGWNSKVTLLLYALKHKQNSFFEKIDRKVSTWPFQINLLPST